MIYVTQLIHVRETNSNTFAAFDSALSALIQRHSGIFLFRLRPDPLNLVASTIGIPYEVQLLRFETEEAFEKFLCTTKKENVCFFRRNTLFAQ